MKRLRHGKLKLSIFETISPIVRTRTKQITKDGNEQNKHLHYLKTTNKTINSYYTACTVWDKNRLITPEQRSNVMLIKATFSLTSLWFFFKKAQNKRVNKIRKNGQNSIFEGKIDIQNIQHYSQTSSLLGLRVSRLMISHLPYKARHNNFIRQFLFAIKTASCDV